MSHGENPERLFPDDVRYIEREHSKVDSVIGTPSEAVDVRVIGNPQNTPVHLVLESASQATTSILVVEDRVEKLMLSFIDKADRHGLKRVSAARITSS